LNLCGDITYGPTSNHLFVLCEVKLLDASSVGTVHYYTAQLDEHSH